MIEQGLIKSHFVGRDGFIWWIGQIVDETQWTPNIPGTPTKTTKEQKGFDFRYKVRIMGYHTAAPNDLKDEELPWASVMFPVTAGVSGGGVSTPNLRQGNFVYGFFMDGEDAQMPIIMGVLGYNQYTAVMKNVPDTAFTPFSGYRTKPLKTEEGVAEADHVPSSSNPTTQEKAEETATAERVEASKTNNDKIAESSVGIIGRNDGASKEQYENEKKPLFIPSSSKCEQAPMVGIQRDVKNMIADIQRIKKTVNDWETKVSTTLPKGIEAEIAKVKDNTNKAISSKVKKIVTEIQRNALKKVNSVASDSYDKVFPTQLPEINAQMEEANDLLSCIFKNIMKNLTSMIGGFLDGATDRMINAPECAVTDFTADILGKVAGEVDAVIDQAMKPIQSLLAGMGASAGAVGDVMGFTSDALSFLTCDEEPNCSDVKEWNPVNGAEAPATLDLNQLVSKARAAKEAFKAAGNITGFDIDFSNIFSKFGVSAGGCNVGPRDCGPPTVEFIGGGGSGARGNAIISASTALIGIDIISAGSGYTSPPRIVINDACSKGRGAVARAVLGPVVSTDTTGTTGTTTTIGTNLGVTQVIIEDSGIDYLPAPDGSRGGNGTTWATPEETVVKRGGNFPGSGGIPGIYDTPHKPGEVIQLYPGDEYTPPGGATEIITTDTSRTCPPLPPSGVKPGVFPSSGSGEYPVILEIEDIHIADGGYGYDPSKDKVIIEAEDGTSKGAEATIKTDPLGSVIGVDVIAGGMGFNEEPLLYIESDTGYNARIMPVFKVNRVGEDIDPETVTPTALIQVVDCVGKF